MGFCRRMAFASALVVAGVASVAPAAAGQQDFLIGRWLLSETFPDQYRPGITCTRAGYAFAPDRFGFLVDGKMSVFPVLGYAADGGYASVTSQTGSETFQVIDQNTIEYTQITVRCRYTRLPN